MTLASSSRRIAASVLAALSIVLFSGCGDALSPTSPSRSQGVLETAEEPSMLEGDWYQVGSGKVMPGREVTIQGSRYTLHFAKGSVKRATTVIIEEHSSDVIDVRFSPDGAEFKGTVTLTVDYAGTVNEAVYRTFGMARFDPATGRWVSRPGHNNPASRTYTMELDGFSRYALLDAPSSDQIRGNFTDRMMSDRSR
jgi:hypothetical protein